MRRLLCLFTTAALLLADLSLTGCVVVAPRHPDRVWVPGYWGAPHVWIEGHWRYR